MQKTLTVNGKRYTGKQISKMFNINEMTNGDDYIVYLGGYRFYANYRKAEDYFAPTCDADEANAIALMPDNGSYRWSTWLVL
jgi:hypothetical protein